MEEMDGRGWGEGGGEVWKRFEVDWSIVGLFHTEEWNRSDARRFFGLFVLLLLLEFFDSRIHWFQTHFWISEFDFKLRQPKNDLNFNESGGVLLAFWGNMDAMWILGWEKKKTVSTNRLPCVKNRLDVKSWSGIYFLYKNEWLWNKCSGWFSLSIPFGLCENKIISVLHV